MALPLILYLGIFREVEIYLLEIESLKFRSTTSDRPLLSTHIFCNPSRRTSAKSIIWNPDDLDCILKSGPLKMEAFPHRILFSSILERKYTQLLSTLQQPSVLDRQGQHTATTSSKNYAVLQLQHSTGFHFSAHFKQILSCQEMHSFCFLSVPLVRIKPTNAMADDSMDNTIHTNQFYALNIAREAVSTTNNLASSSPERAAVMSRMSYLRIKFPSYIDSNDLLRVASSLLYCCPSKHGTKGNTMQNKDLNDFTRLTASAATLVSPPLVFLAAYST